MACSDGPSWLVTFGGERNVVARTDELSTATATVTVTSSALYLWAWNRSADVTIDGEDATTGLWQRITL